MSSRKEQKEALRQERLERERQAAAGARRKRLVGYGAAAALGLAALIAVAVVLLAGGDDGGGGSTRGDFPDGSAPEQRETDLKRAAAAAGCELKDFREEGRVHTADPVTYGTNPPTSGNHHPSPAEDAAYTEAPPTESLVHTLEHGRIEIQFRPDAPNSVKGDLKALYDEDPPGMVLTPNETGMPYEVAATAWTHLLGCRKMNNRVFDAIRAFKDAYRGRGPEAVAF